MKTFPSPFQTHNGSRFKDGSIHEQLFESVSFLNTEFRITKCQGNNIKTYTQTSYPCPWKHSSLISVFTDVCDFPLHPCCACILFLLPPWSSHPDQSLSKHKWGFLPFDTQIHLQRFWSVCSALNTTADGAFWRCVALWSNILSCVLHYQKIKHVIMQICMPL